MGDILFLAHRLPYPPDRGDRIRSFHLLKAMAELGQVHLACFADNEAELAHVEALRPLVGRCHVELRRRSLVAAGVGALASGRPVSLAAYDSPPFRSAVAALLAERPIDTIFVFSGQMAQHVPEDIGRRRFVMDFVDVDSAKFETYARKGNWPMRFVNAREGRLMAAYERQVAERADLSLFVSEAEAGFFRARTGLGSDRVAVLENGIDLDHFDPAHGFEGWSKGPMILFTGQMDYRPNIDAVEAFARDVFPAVRAAYPDARFAIVGREPTPAVMRLGGLPGVIVTGAVPDVRPWLADASVVVAPLGIARGVQNKVLEAMAMGRPVVASPAAFEGIDAQPGRDLVVAANAEMAKPVLALLADPGHAATIGRNARLRMEARYGWAARLSPLAGFVGRQPVSRTKAA